MSELRCLLAAFVLASSQAALGPFAAAHPLDPLSADEIAAAVAVLHSAGDVDAIARFALIDLAEPDKAAVLAWRPSRTVERRAVVIARQRRMVFEGIVDLATHTVERWRAVANVQSALLPDELKQAQRVVMADPRWRAAMLRRGYDPARAAVAVSCAPLAAGYAADPAVAHRRLVRVECFDTGKTDNVWARPIEGLYATVDLDAEKVIRLIDSGAIPVSRDAARLPRDPVPRSAANSSRAQPDFTIAGNSVRWQRWSFRYRLDPRTGLVLSLVRYDDAGRRRMVLYRGSLAEMFVPYMDPDPGWSFRNYMDVGEYGVGPLSLPLTPGVDCPVGATLLDVVLPDEFGKPVKRDGVICLFDHSTDAPLWRHADTGNSTYAGRPARELVMRTILSIGNYDYLIDWVLTEAGAIRIDVGVTGIDQVKGVRAQTMADASAARDTAWGNLVAPGLVGVNHDHFLSFRLDVDIDGERNTLVRQRLIPVCTAAGTNERRSLWRVLDEPVEREGPLRDNGPGDALWIIENPDATNRLGQHPAYELRPDHTVTSMSMPMPDDAGQRAAFSSAPSWVSAYDPDELYAAGLFPNQSKGGDGLPAYVAQHRPVANADIVLWYTMGFHHVPRPEDWPVMSTMWHSLSLVPYGFFGRNPTIEAPGDGADPAAPKMIRRGGIGSE
jgi:primary-amine oxidase